MLSTCTAKLLREAEGSAHFLWRIWPSEMLIEAHATLCQGHMVKVVQAEVRRGPGTVATGYLAQVVSGVRQASIAGLASAQVHRHRFVCGW